MIINLRQTILVLTTLLVSACSFMSEKPVVISQEWQQTEARLKALNSWTVMGKIGIRTPEDNVTAAINRWQQHHNSFLIDLSSTFFGLGATRLLGNEHFLTIIEQDETPLSSDQPDALIEEALGFALPINQLVHWIKGIPAANGEHTLELASSGVPTKLEQSGWTIEYSKHRLHDDLALPHKIKLTRNDTRIIFAIKEWTLQTASD